MATEILVGDMREKLKELADDSIDSVVCDPPYHLTSIVKRFGAKDAAPAKAEAKKPAPKKEAVPAKAEKAPAKAEKAPAKKAPAKKK